MLTPIPNTFGNLTIGYVILVLGILYLNIASSKLNLLLNLYAFITKRISCTFPKVNSNSGNIWTCLIHPHHVFKILI